MVARLKRLGDLAELRVAADLVRRGHQVLLPFGEDCRYDLAVDRGDGRLERIQVKYTASDGRVVEVRCRTTTVTAGRVRATARYTAAEVDWLAVFDATTDRCYYVPASRFDGRSVLHLRLRPARNGQQRGVTLAADCLDL